MKKAMTSLLVAVALMIPGMKSWADDVNATGKNNNPVTHPVNAYENHDIKEDMKESQEDSQKAKEAKATYKQAKSDYEKSLKANGAESKVTKDAHARMKDARKEMNKYENKAAKVNQDLKKDEMKTQ